MCVSAAEWLCPCEAEWLWPPISSPPLPFPPPPPPKCAGAYGNCYTSFCCSSPSFSCKKLSSARFAMCRPHGPSGLCEHEHSPRGEWPCIGEEGWMLPPAVPPYPPGLPLPPAPPAPHAPPCASDFANCFSSRCCASLHFACFKKETPLATPPVDRSTSCVAARALPPGSARGTRSGTFCLPLRQALVRRPTRARSRTANVLSLNAAHRATTTMTLFAT